jgi:hypothetical protein
VNGFLGVGGFGLFLSSGDGDVCVTGHIMDVMLYYLAKPDNLSPCPIWLSEETRRGLRFRR